MAQKNQHSFGLLPKIINGSIAGIVGVTCVFPLDLVKTRLQNQQVNRNGERAYRSILHCGVSTFRNEGFLGMYRGVGVNLLLITPEKAIKLVGNDFFRYRLTTKEGLLPLHREVMAGAAAGCCQVVVTTPMELLKIQMQDAGRTVGSSSIKSSGTKSMPARLQDVSAMQRRMMQTGHSAAAPALAVSGSSSSSARSSRPSATRLAMGMLREHGVRGLFKGYSSTMLRDVTFSAFYFPLFANFNRLGKGEDGEKAPFYVTLLSGIAAGSVSCFVVTPLDVVKTRLQTVRKHGENNFSGIVDCFVKTYQHEGVRAFFKGGACRMMVIAPLFGIAQVVYFMGIGEKMLGVDKQ